MPVGAPAAHASNLLPMPPQHAAAMMVFWFSGTKESAPDIQIAASQFDRASQQWQAARFVVNRQTLGQSLGFGVRRLGNPVAWLDARGQVHLFVVATGLGGWAASRVVHLRQSQPGQTFENLSFEVLRVLPLSWLWNTSHLVRAVPLALQDGGMVLPVYFELGIKYPVALRFDAEGAFLGMARMSGRTHLLQPSMVIRSDTHWLALMRDQRPDGKVAVAQTLDGGQHWADMPDLALVNPNSSVAALGITPKQMLLVHNSLPDSRQVLDLSQSADGVAWQLTEPLAHSKVPAEYSYPSLVWAEDGFWVSYTEQRRTIAWARFAPAKP
jgi:predicted neuraminidase